MVSIIPWIGDLAKAGKLGKWAQLLTKVVARAQQNIQFARRVAPLLKPILEAVNRMLDTPALTKHLPDGAKAILEGIKKQLDEFFENIAKKNGKPELPNSETPDLHEIGKNKRKENWEHPDKKPEPNNKPPETDANLTPEKKTSAQEKFDETLEKGKEGVTIEPNDFPEIDGKIRITARNGDDILLDVTNGVASVEISFLTHFRHPDLMRTIIQLAKDAGAKKLIINSGPLVTKASRSLMENAVKSGKKFFGGKFKRLSDQTYEIDLSHLL